MRHLVSRTIFGLVCTVAVWGLPAALRAQESSSSGGSADNRLEYPLQIIHAAGVERLQQKADLMFLAADRPEMSDIVAQWLKTSLSDLPGWDRSRPFGMMLYLKPGLVPGISAITYIPTTDPQATLTLLAGPEGSVKPITGKTDRFEINDISWGPDLTCKHVGNYLFFTSQTDATELDRRFPEPEKLVSKLTSRYDIAYQLLLKNIPPATRQMFVAFFKTTVQADLQQRDDEPDAAYRIRRANGESILDLADKIVNQGEELTIGGLVNPQTSAGMIEIELNGSKDSKLAKFFQDMEGRRSLFTPVLENPATMTFNMSWQMDAKQRKVFTELFTAAPELADDAAKKNDQPAALDALQPFFKTLLNTAELGHFDFFVQLSGEEPLDYRFISGVRIVANREFPGQFQSLLEYVKTMRPPEEKAAEPEAAPAANAQPNPPANGNRRRRNNGPRPDPQRMNAFATKFIQTMKIADTRIGDYPVHTIQIPAAPDAMGKTLFSDAPNLHLYATPNSIWLAMGGDSALDTLRKNVDQVADAANATGAPRPASGPFLFVTNAKQWVTAASATGETDDDDVGFAAAVDRFKDDNDELRITSRATDSGVRTRVDLQSGYVGWLGRVIAAQIIRAQE
ncbi:MAG TPA: hypothetical protein VFG20_22235 [Planctomycetaceae bacterium]|nr:hypothetical protein [Planctomycetaceae bacterium]